MTASQRILLCGTGGFASEVVAEFPGRFGAVFDPFSDTSSFEGLPTYRNLAEAQSAGLGTAVIAVGQPKVARRIHQELSQTAITLAEPLVSPHAVITGNDVRLGNGCLIMAGTILTNHISLGLACVVNINCTIGHGSTFGDFVSVMPLTAISGGVTLADGCYLGSQVFVRENVSIAPESVIGAMAGVFADISDPGGVWVGSPARRRVES